MWVLYFDYGARWSKRTVDNDEYGCVIPNNNEEILLEALEHVIGDKAKRERGIELTYNRIKDHFTWGIVANQVEKICEEN